MLVVGGVIAWNTFKVRFLDNYFPRDLRKQRAREFLDLKQGNMSMGDYTAKFNAARPPLSPSEQ